MNASGLTAHAPSASIGDMRIGRHLIEPPVILAPMAGVTDKPFRRLCKQLGAGLAVSEMTASDPRLWSTPKSRRRMDHAGEPAPVSVQIAGYDPHMLADAARHNADHGAEIIDINMGCPAKKVCNIAAGSALLRDDALVARILDAVVGAVAVPVTLKIRTGYARERRNAVEIARIAEAAGIAALAVHGRTREDYFQGEAEYDTIAAVKAAVDHSRDRQRRYRHAGKGARRARADRLRCPHDRPRRAGAAVDLSRDRALSRDRRASRRSHAGGGARHAARAPVRAA